MGLFKKLFGRKPKQPTNDENIANVNDTNRFSKQEKKKEKTSATSKKERKKEKKLMKRKKKNDKLAHFPSKEQPLAAAHDASSSRLLIMDDEEKENTPASVRSRATNANAVPHGRNRSGGVLSVLPSATFAPMDDAPDMLVDTAVADAGVEHNTDLENFGTKRANKENRPLVSPTMSGNKPPLTPNRISNGRSVKPLTPSNRLPLSPSLGQTAGWAKKSTVVDLDEELENHNAALTQKENAAEKETQPGLDNVSLRVEAAEASFDMCLSSDNEDDDYSRVLHNVTGKPTAVKGEEKAKNDKFVSALDRSPFSYASDDDNALFPALVDDKDPFATARDPTLAINEAGASKPAFKQMGQSASTHVPPSKQSKPEIIPMAHETQEDIRAWSPSPKKKASFTFSGNDKLSSPSPRSIATPKSAGPTASKGTRVLFDNFADFEHFDPTKRGSNKGSNSVSHTPSSPVSALLEESREKRRSRRNFEPSRSGSTSINSAPMITASYLRQHVRKSSHGGDAGSSISRVIDNIEMHVNKREQKESRSGRDVTSLASSHRSSDSAIREAKERMRRENIANESRMIDILASGSGGGKSINGKQNENWLFDEVTGALGPRSVAADLESLGGRSNRSGKSKNSIGNKSHRSHRSSRHGNRRHKSKRTSGGDESVDSRTSRRSGNSYRSYQTTKSMVSQMSEASRSVTNDLLRLEAQLSMVGKRSGGGESASSVAASEHGKRRDDCGMTVATRDFAHGRSSVSLPRGPGGSKDISASARRAAAVTLRSKITVVAPPGKLGIILANRTDSRGTVVSGVRTSSVLAEQVSPGDRIIGIDDEDVSHMNVKEITTIMARKSEFDRVLVLLAAPKYQYD